MNRQKEDRAISKATGEGRSNSLTLVDVQQKRQQALRQNLTRLGPMASLAMALATLPVCLFALLGFLGVIPTELFQAGGIQAYALNSFFFLGFIPLTVTSLALAIFRPQVLTLLGPRPGLPVLLASPALGFFLGCLAHTGLQLLSSYFPFSSAWIAVPDLWQKGSLYLGRSTIMTVTVLTLSVLLPASTHELLHRGLILPAYVELDGSLLKMLWPSLLAASLPLDLPGFALYLILALMTSWVRLTSGSLLASALSSAGYGLAMLFARPLTRALSYLVFGMPLIDSLRLRLYLVSLALILIVLMLIPRAILETGTSPYLKGSLTGSGGERPEEGKTSSKHLVLFLCLAALWACLYLFS